MLASNQKRDFWTTDDADYVDGDFSIRDIREIRGQVCLIAHASRNECQPATTHQFELDIRRTEMTLFPKLRVTDCLGTAFVAVTVILIVALTISLQAETNCVPAPSGLVSWWRGENNVIDQNGLNNGEALGSPQSYAPGEVGQAFEFDGSGDNIINVGVSGLELQDFTIEGWIKRTSTSSIGSGGDLGIVLGFGDGGYEFGMTQNGALYLGVNSNDYNVVQYGLTSTGQINDTEFHHCVVTKLGSNVIFYIDGVGDSSSQFEETFQFPSGASAAIGQTADDWYPIEGIIDELSVYDRPLTASEIQAIYNAGSAGKCLEPTAPFIFDQPTNETVFAGNSASFAVVASSGGPIFYQWFFDQTNIARATNATLLITNAKSSDDGTYSVIVSNSYDVLISSNAVLTVDLIPDIVAQPTNQTVGAYYPASLSVSAVGPEPLLYQWTFDGTNLNGATNSILSFECALPSQAGTYSVIVGTPPNTTNSSNAVLSVTLPPPPTILTQPASHIGVVEDYTTFTVAAQSQAPVPMYYQWNWDGTNLPGATTANWSSAI